MAANGRLVVVDLVERVVEVPLQLLVSPVAARLDRRLGLGQLFLGRVDRLLPGVPARFGLVEVGPQIAEFLLEPADPVLRGTDGLALLLGGGASIVVPLLVVGDRRLGLLSVGQVEVVDLLVEVGDPVVSGVDLFNTLLDLALQLLDLRFEVSDGRRDLVPLALEVVQF